MPDSIPLSSRFSAVDLASMLWEGPKTSYGHAQAVKKAQRHLDRAMEEERDPVNVDPEVAPPPVDGTNDLAGGEIVSKLEG